MDDCNVNKDVHPTPEDITRLAMFKAYCFQRRYGLSHSQCTRLGFPDAYRHVYAHVRKPRENYGNANH